MVERSVQPILDIKAETSLRLRVINLLEKARKFGLAEAVHQHCQNIYQNDIHSIDGNQLLQLEKTFAYFFIVLSNEAKPGATIQ